MPLFQARHYEIIATKFAPKLSWPDKIHELAKYLAEDNPKFDSFSHLKKTRLYQQIKKNL